MPIDTGLWSPWGAGTQDESGGSLNQSATGVAGEYLGVSSVSTYDFTNKTLQVHIRQLPTNATGVQAYFRAEVDANNGVVFGFGDGNLFCQTHIAGAYATPYATAWPAGTAGLKLVFDNAQNRLWYASTVDGTTWTAHHSLVLPFATTALKVILATGCYQAVASPGTLRWESTGLPVDFTPTDPYGSTIYGTSGLTAYWRMADTSITFLRDSSGSGRHGFYTGAPAFGQTGPLAIANPSVDLSGANDDAGWIDPVFPLSGSFTLECWVRADSWVDFAPIFNRRRWEVSEGGISLEVRNDYARETMGTPPVEPRAPGDGYIYCFLYSTAWAWVSNDTPLTTGEWHHIVFAYDVSVTTIWMYVDGVFEVGNPSCGVLNNPTVNVSIQIGRNVEFGHLFDGRIDEMALYNRALTAQEVADHYALGSALPGAVFGSAAGRATVSGTITRKRALAGTAVGTSTASGTVSIKPVSRYITGTATGSSTASGTLTRRRGLSAAAAGTSTASGTPTRKRALVAAAAGTSTATGAATRRRALLGTSAGTSVAAGVVDRKPVTRDMVGLSSGLGVSGGQITRRRAIVAASAGVATTTAVLTRKRALVAAAAGTSTATGAVSRRRTMASGLATGTSTASGTVTRRRALVASAVGSSSAAGLLSRKRGLAATAVGSSTATAVPTARRALAGTAIGGSVANGKVTIKPLAVPVYWDGNVFTLEGFDLVAWATDDAFRINRPDLPTVLWPGPKQPFILEE